MTGIVKEYHPGWFDYTGFAAGMKIPSVVFPVKNRLNDIGMTFPAIFITALPELTERLMPLPQDLPVVQRFPLPHL